MNDTKQDLEAKAGDPWGLLGRQERSGHCEGKKAKITSYDHTGYTRARCDCGQEYVHDQGAYESLLVPPCQVLIIANLK